MEISGQIYGSKFNVTHRNGKPLKGRYFVLNLDSRNLEERERSRKAMQLYIQKAVTDDPNYALELLKFYTDASMDESAPSSKPPSSQQTSVSLPKA